MKLQDARTITAAELYDRRKQAIVLYKKGTMTVHASGWDCHFVRCYRIGRKFDACRDDINYIDQTVDKHIVTLEDLIECIVFWFQSFGGFPGKGLRATAARQEDAQTLERTTHMVNEFETGRDQNITCIYDL